MNNNYLVNPFVRIAGIKSLAAGLAGLLIVSFLAFQSGTHHFGLTNIDYAKDSGFFFYFFEHLSNWIFISIFFYFFGLVLSKSRIRIIDILGTSLLARWPLIITPLFRLLPWFRSFVFGSWKMYLLTGIYLVCLIWTIVLLFNAYRVSTNLKNERLIISFIISLILAEISTRIFFSY